MPSEFEIRAAFDAHEIALYAAFDSSIAKVALAKQQLLPPFAYDRMTWVKPSFLWLMYRSEWGQSAGMESVLRIWIGRREWEAALEEAVLTTPERHVYPDAKAWRTRLDKAKIRVQWDPERDIRNQRLNYRSIQVGIMPQLSEAFAKRWIRRIEDLTPLCRRIRSLVLQGTFSEAEALLPLEQIYPVSPRIQKNLGM